MLATTFIIPTALVSQMGGGNEEKAKVVQTLLLVAGINTLLQTNFGTRLPTVMGGSFTFVAPTISIILSGRWSDLEPVARFEKIMRAVQGALIVASTLQIVLGFSGLWRNVARFLSPLSAVPLVSLAGFGLYEFGFPGVAKCVEIGLPELIILVVFSQVIFLTSFIPKIKTSRSVQLESLCDFSEAEQPHKVPEPIEPTPSVGSETVAVTSSLTVTKARLRNAREEREHFDQASNQILDHFNAKDKLRPVLTDIRKHADNIKGSQIVTGMDGGNLKADKGRKHLEEKYLELEEKV
ncbi:hypothetical protein POM88_029476 [Heracleum sosnowskyi]|uniref:Uncharacterized protein n=1 Tax=Heracleum sosnowskyi TaxID=360622 RepID=A0AAD8HUU1_9APIA|nr:hypothetical protein POM88_029476 [Heracleum sosnowskyi]